MAIKVTLLAHTPDPEQTVAMAAKLCYSPSGIEDIREGLTEEKTASFINMLASLGHASPTEHASFTFGIEGISRACSHQLVRHRIASYSQQSQRYVDGTKFDFVTPPAVAANPRALDAYNRVIDAQAQAYREIRDALAAGYINEYLGEVQQGSDEEIIAAFRETDKAQCAAFIKKANERICEGYDYTLVHVHPTSFHMLGEILDTKYVSPSLLELKEEVDPSAVARMKISQVEKNNEILSTTE